MQVGQETALLGVGIYSVPEAAKLVGLDPPRVHRWVRGYDYRDREGDLQRSPPLFPRDLPDVDGIPALTFLDLIELRFVKLFVDQGVSLPAIRRAAGNAVELFDTRHPFCVKRFRTDGRTVFAGLDAEFSDDEKLLDLVNKQFVFGEIIEPFLKELEYQADGVARWWPLGRKEPVVIDPRRSFGQPILAESGVPTRVLFGASIAGEKEKSIAEWFEVPRRDVRAALRFEQRLAA